MFQSFISSLCEANAKAFQLSTKFMKPPVLEIFVKRIFSSVVFPIHAIHTLPIGDVMPVVQSAGVMDYHYHKTTYDSVWAMGYPCITQRNAKFRCR